MSFEARKTNLLRTGDFMSRYFSGDVLDIGCGPDLVVPHARPFDHEQGDASRIVEFLPSQSFDTVHSSHCLEHMPDVPTALKQWWSLVRPGGFLVLVVPEEDLYEQGYWPSLFSDHKATFRLDRPTRWSPISFDLRQLLISLPAAKIIDIAIQDHGYDYSVLNIARGRRGFWTRRVRRFSFRAIRFVAFRVCRLDRDRWEARVQTMEGALGRPRDQTAGEAVAQIQAVCRKLRREEADKKGLDDAESPRSQRA
jgi:SAM-dependent methyltransferase